MVRIRDLIRHLPELIAGFWFVTTLFLLLGPALMVVLVTIDGLAGEAGVFPGLFISPSSAQTILGTIAGSLVTVATLTSSLTVVTLQLLSTQFTPRALRGFVRSKLSKVVLGSLIGIVLYCLLVAVTVRDPGDVNRRFVPSLSVVVSILLALVGLVLLVMFIHHMVTSIQVSNLAATIAKRTRDALATAHAEAATATPGLTRDPGRTEYRPAGLPDRVLLAERPGYVRSVDPVAAARDLGGRPAFVRFTVRPGDFVTRTSPILEVYCARPLDRPTVALLRHTAPVTHERDLAGDPGFGLRQLTDIALRAIAPGVNDPSSAVTCIGYLQDLLSSVAAAPLPATRTARHRATTVVAPRQTFALYVSSLVEIGRYARDARVATALLDALAGIATAVNRAEPEGSHGRNMEVIEAAATAVGGQAIDDARSEMDRDQLRAALGRVTRLIPVAAPAVTADARSPVAHPELVDTLVRAAEARTAAGSGERSRPTSTSAPEA